MEGGWLSLSQALSPGGSNFFIPHWNVSISQEYSIIKQTVEKLKDLNERK